MMGEMINTLTLLLVKMLVLLSLIWILLIAYHRKSEGRHRRIEDVANRIIGKKNFTKTLKVPEGIVLGKNLFGRYVCTSMESIRHVLIIGTSGCGKTSANLIPTLRSIQGKVYSYVIDLGDIMDNVPSCEEQRFVLEPGNPNSMRFNIFSEVDKALSKSRKHELLDMLAFRVMPDPRGSKGDGDWFVSEGRKILTAALKCFYFYKGMDFVEIAETITGHDTIDLLNMIAVTCDQDESIMRYIRGFSGANERNTSGCKQAVDAALTLFATNEVIKAVLGRGEESFSAADLERGNVYIRVPSNRLTVYAPMLALVTSSFVQYFQDRSPIDETGKRKNNLLFCLDELNAYGEGMLIGLEELLKRGRKHGIAVMACTQSLSDLYVIYGHDATDALLENFSFVCVLQLGAADLVSQRYFSELSGRKRKSPGESYGKEYRFNLEEFATLDRKLILFYPGGCRQLTKAYYWK